MESGNRTRELIIASADLSDILTRGAESYARLDPAQKVRFGIWCRNVFSTANVGYARHLMLRHDPALAAGEAIVNWGAIGAGRKPVIHPRVRGISGLA